MTLILKDFDKKKKNDSGSYAFYFIIILIVLIVITAFLRGETAKENAIDKDYVNIEENYELKMRQSLIRESLMLTFSKLTLDEFSYIKQTRESILVPVDQVIYVKLKDGKEISIGYFDNNGLFTSTLE